MGNEAIDVPSVLQQGGVDNEFVEEVSYDVTRLETKDVGERRRNPENPALE
jgi:hypothetical protein